MTYPWLNNRDILLTDLNGHGMTLFFLSMLQWSGESSYAQGWQITTSTGLIQTRTLSSKFIIVDYDEDDKKIYGVFNKTDECDTKKERKSA